MAASSENAISKGAVISLSEARKRSKRVLREITAMRTTIKAKLSIRADKAEADFDSGRVKTHEEVVAHFKAKRKKRKSSGQS